MELIWLGWASWLIKTNGKNIYIDPFEGKISEKADIILCSHNHPDHCDIGRINEIRKSSTRIFSPSVFATQIGAEHLDVGQIIDIYGIKIEAVNAYNLQIPNHQKGVDTGFIIEAEGKRVYFAADTDFIPEMKTLGKIDAALLPIGGTFTMDIEQAVLATKMIRPKVVMPMHYGSTDVVMDGKQIHVELKANPDEFKAKIGSAAKTAVLEPGERFVI